MYLYFKIVELKKITKKSNDEPGIGVELNNGLIVTVGENDCHYRCFKNYSWGTG